MNSSRDIEFLYEIGSLRNLQRGWRQHFGLDCANDLEHTMRVVFLSMILAKRINQPTDEKKLLLMALVHDLAETRVSDLGYVQKVYVKTDEAIAAHDLFEQTSLADLEQILKEFEKKNCLEAKIVKDADNLDVDLEIKELEEKGSRLAGKWSVLRKKVRDEKLYTQEAKNLWDEIQNSDPADWHLKTNKWLKIEGAGK